MLKGRPIGLHANMSVEEMQNHLIKIKQLWLAEGYSKEEVDNAILSKCRPLLIGFYWRNYPESCRKLSEALQNLNYQTEHIPQKINKLNKPIKNIVKIKEESLIEQFAEV